MREFHFNSVVADYIAAGLKEYDAEVIYTHEMDSDVPLRDRTNKANSYKADVFISIHANAYGSGGWNNVQGIETFVHNNSGSEAFDLATKIQNELLTATNRPNRGVKKSNFHVLRESSMPAILIECGFMTNKEEAELLKSDAYRIKCANAILMSLINYYNFKKKNVKPLEIPQIKQATKVTYKGKQLSAWITDQNRSVAEVRELAELIGLKVYWNSKTQTVELS